MKKLIEIQNELKVPKNSIHKPEYYAETNGCIFSFRYGKYKQLKPQLKKNGYYSVCLHNKTYSIHRLVAMAFIKNELNKREVNHIDGNKLNNCVYNLEWVTSSENQKHAFKNGLQVIKRNNSVYSFKNNNTNEIFKGTVFELRQKYNIKNHQHFSKLIKGQIKSLYNIILWNN